MRKRVCFLLFILFLLPLFIHMPPREGETRLFWNKPVYFSVYEKAEVRLHNNEPEEFISAVFFGFEQFLNGEWVVVDNVFYGGGGPAIGLIVEPGNDEVWGHTFPLNMLFPGRYRVWRHAYFGESIYRYAEFYYAGSLFTTILPLLIILAAIFRSHVKLESRIWVAVNYVFFHAVLLRIHDSYAKNLNAFEGRHEHSTIVVEMMVILLFLSLRSFIKFSDITRNAGQKASDESVNKT